MLVGSTTLATEADPHEGGTANINSYVAAQSGSVGHISVWLVSGNATQVFVGLYSDKSGEPDSLLTVGTLDPDWANVNGGAWRTAAVSPAVPVTSGTKYWLAILSPANGGEVDFGYYTTGTDAWSTWEHSASASLSLLPCQWVGETTPVQNGTEVSMFATP